ncbi:358137e5-3eab-4f24-98d5-e75fbe8a2dec [Sclerotinia trifoliorum]|uniref:358137e5-3eab-4f24-98d5-e75fbe8a2dec n=1 Tax=Sclerotinia trifoliorum TaxID=28548 RepID=A0A8H2W7G0_9HELO|nr:358137e5-3eab-4f24-98d5-e75fbe8a2dec [Sclerotinia trifoliorum]
MGKGSKNKEASHANADKPSDSKIYPIDISNAPIADSPMLLIQKLTNYIEGEEKNSTALRNETQLLKEQLQESEEEARASKTRSENLEQELQQLRDESKTRINTTERIEQELNDERTKYRSEKRSSESERKKLQKELTELQSVMRMGRNANTLLQQEIKKRRQDHWKETENLKRVILELNQRIVKEDIMRDAKDRADVHRIASAPAGECKAEFNACISKSARAGASEQDLAIKNRVVEKSAIGVYDSIHPRVNPNTKSVEPVIFLTRSQIERKDIWQKSLFQILNSKLENEKEHRAFVEEWHATYTGQDNFDMALYLILACSQMDDSVLVIEKKCIALETELSKQKMKMLERQESLIASHAKVVSGMEGRAELALAQEKVNQDDLKEAHTKEINALKASFETRIMELEEEHRPYRDIAERILARERECSKPPKERSEEIMDQGNLAAHGGNCLAVSKRIASSPNFDDNEWFESLYGVSIETFTKYQDSLKMRRLLDMRYEMSKFKTVQLAETEFERNFQYVMTQLTKKDHLQKTSSGKPWESWGSFSDDDGDLESAFNSMCKEYHGTAENEKKRRKMGLKNKPGPSTLDVDSLSKIFSKEKQ